MVYAKIIGNIINPMQSTTHLQRHTSPDTEANLCKRVLLADASKTPTHD